MPQVRALAHGSLLTLRASLTSSEDPESQLLAMEIERFLERPVEPMPAPSLSTAPPGAPIGTPALDWLH
jgi:hypothetical protein